MNIKYMARIAKGATFQNLKRVISHVKKQNGKNSFFILFDIALCFLKYGAGYNDYDIFEFYNMNSAERKTYLTRIKNKKLVTQMNDSRYAHIFDEKNLFDEKFQTFMGREILDIAKIDYKKFEQFINGKEYFFAKPYIGESGKGIEKIRVSDFKDTKTLYEYITQKEKNFGVIEEVILQHPAAAAIYPHSLNCLRVVTLVHENVPHILYSVFKTGNNGKYVDNLENGGLACHFDLDKGEITGPGHTSSLEIYDAHPETKTPLIGYKLPFMQEVKDMVKQAAMVIPEFRYVGWDICLTPNGPAIVEGNDFPAYDFPQLPDPDKPRVGLLPKIKSFGIKL